MARNNNSKVERAVYYTTLSDTSEARGGNASKNAVKIKFAWYGSKNAYPSDVAKELGVVAAKENEAGLIFGMNNPRPARVYINVKTEKGNKSYFVFANPLKIATLLVKGALRGKTYRGGKVTSVSLPKTSTNPTRSKKSSSKPGTKPPKQNVPKKNNKL